MRTGPVMIFSLSCLMYVCTRKKTEFDQCALVVNARVRECVCVCVLWGRIRDANVLELWFVCACLQCIDDNRVGGVCVCVGGHSFMCGESEAVVSCTLVTAIIHSVLRQ